MKVSIFWFRRDLRLEDNVAFFHSLQSEYPVLPIFIFDDEILDELPKNDPRLNFIHNQLKKLNSKLNRHDSSIKTFHSNYKKAWQHLDETYEIKEVYFNEDYEPYALERDKWVNSYFNSTKTKVNSFTDHVVFKPGVILKDNGLPYTVYTPFKNKWLKHFELNKPEILPSPKLSNLLSKMEKFPSMGDLGFSITNIKVEPFSLVDLDNYENTRDIPSLNATSYLGPHLRFGTVSVRGIIDQLKNNHFTFLSELIWREFFIQIMYHFPRVVTENFKPKYNGINWINNETDYQLWCKGKTGYPIVDAGMRQLNETGYMHNRVRMITASFLCKHLLIDWTWGEAYFAEKLLDYELASNNGNWQWVAGTGCDAAPYFRVFSPSAQTLKFDPDLNYIKKWVPEINELSYSPMLDHKMARERAIKVYKTGIESIH